MKEQPLTSSDEIAEPGPPEVEAAELRPLADLPMRAVLDATTGAVRYEPITGDELVAARAERAVQAERRAELDAVVEAKQTERDADLEVVKARAAADEDYAALARLAGIDL